MSSEPTAVPQLRPLGIGEILDVGIKITIRHWWVLVRAVLVVVVPLQVLSSMIDLSVAEGAFSTGGPRDEIDPDEIWTVIAAVIAAALLALLAQTIATGACFKIVADAYLGRAASWRRSVAEILRRLHSILWISTLTYVLAFFALLACILPGVWLYMSWAVAIPAFLTEGVKGRRALGRSFRLVKGFWWRTFAIIVLGAILAGIVQSALGAVVAAVTFSSDGDVVPVIANFLGSVIGGALTTPFIAAVTIVLYIDLRVRKEGFDLALLAARLGDGPPAEDASVIPLPPAPPFLPRPAPERGGSQPPYWPPPPGWKPGSEDS